MKSIGRFRKEYGPAICILPALLIILLMLMCIGSSCSTAAEGRKMLLVGFERADDEEGKSLPKGWERLPYVGRAENEVSLEEDGDKTVVRVKSLRSASALLARPEVLLEDYPMLVWRWKVTRVVGMAVESRKDRNDCAARVRVIFGEQKPISIEKNPLIEKLLDKFGITMPDSVEPSGYKIDYIWGNNVRKGDVIDYPGSKNHKVVVAQQGNDKAGRWIWERRNIREDFKELFGDEAPGLAAIAVLSDTDQTNEGVEAYFGSIVLMKE